MTYAWIITHDHLPTADMSSRVGKYGPRGISQAQVNQLHAGEGEPFRLVDDDRTLVYEGRFLGDAMSDDAFGPLDDFGMPDAGCTSIEYRVDGRWEVL